MTYTTDQAIALAREVGCLVQEDNQENEYGITLYEFHAKTLTAFANAVRKQTLLKAAEWFKGYQGEDDFVEAQLRRMANGEGKE